MTKPSPNSKHPRNNEIKALYVSGMKQRDIGAMFGIKQCRVSAIVHDVLPPWRRCIYCPTRCYDRTSVCRPCIARNKARRALVSALKRFLRRRDSQTGLRYSYRVFGREVMRIQKNLILDFKAQRRASVFKQPDLFL